MSQTIEIRRRAYSVIPDDVLTDDRLSWAARVVLGWMIGRSAEFVLHVWYVRKVFGLSETQWVRVRRELEAAGYYRAERRHGAGGKMEWTHWVTDTPENIQPSPQKPGDGVPWDGEPSDGRPSGGEQRDKPLGSRTKRSITKDPPLPPRRTDVPDCPACGSEVGDSVGGGVFDVFFDAADRPDQLARERAKLSAILAKANPDQARLAGIAWRETITAGKVSSPVGLAVQLCRRAAKGEITPPATEVQAAKTAQAEAERAACERLKALAGRKYRRLDDDNITYEVINGTAIYIHRADSDRPLTLSGPEALRCLRRIEAGELRPAPDDDEGGHGQTAPTTKRHDKDALYDAVDAILAGLPEPDLARVAHSAAQALASTGFGASARRARQAILARKITNPILRAAALAALRETGMPISRPQPEPA